MADVHDGWVAKLSPSRPSRASNAASLDAEASASKPATENPLASSPITFGSGVQDGRSPSAPGPAASPADRVAQPSVGHVVRCRVLTDTEAAAPSRSSPQSTGVSCAETSSQEMPPTPTTTSDSPGAGSTVRGTGTDSRVV